jgi:hypothetical protein
MIDLRIGIIPDIVAREVFVRYHYLHSMPACNSLLFGAYDGSGHLVGAMSFGSGPRMMHRLVHGATQKDYLVLTRFWMADEMPRNSESRFLGLVFKALRRTSVRFLVSYADPAAGHVGYIYQATNWIYTGQPSTRPLLSFGDRVIHSRSVNTVLGSASVRRLRGMGLDVRTVEQPGKHRYIYFLDKRWRKRLTVDPLPYPKEVPELGGQGDPVEPVA